MELTLDRIKELMAELEESSLSRLRLKLGENEVELEKPSGPPVAQQYVAPPAPAAATSAAEAEEEPTREYITSPMVGVFYSAASPDNAPFVKVGDTVNAATVVCIVEAMKVMNEVKAGKKGTVKKLLVETGHPIEFGTKLFEIG